MERQNFKGQDTLISKVLKHLKLYSSSYASICCTSYLASELEIKAEVYHLLCTTLFNVPIFKERAMSNSRRRLRRLRRNTISTVDWLLEVLVMGFL